MVSEFLFQMMMTMSLVGVSSRHSVQVATFTFLLNESFSPSAADLRLLHRSHFSQALTVPPFPLQMLLTSLARVHPSPGSVAMICWPLKENLRNLLQINGRFDATVTYMNYLKNETNLLINFVQGTLWKEQLNNFHKKVK